MAAFACNISSRHSQTCSLFWRNQGQYISYTPFDVYRRIIRTPPPSISRSYVRHWNRVATSVTVRACRSGVSGAGAILSECTRDVICIMQATKRMYGFQQLTDNQVLVHGPSGRKGRRIQQSITNDDLRIRDLVICLAFGFTG